MSTVAYIGNFKPSHSTETHYAASFEANGWHVEAVQEDELGASGQWQERLRDMVKARTVDLILYTRTWGLPEHWANDLWRYAADQGIPTAAVHLDVWHGLAREHEVGEGPMFRMAHVFTADGDHEDEFEAAGINHHWLRAGVFHGECYDADPDPGWVGRWDVAFVGSAPAQRVAANGHPIEGNYHPEWSHRAELVARLEDWYGDRFVHVGNGGHLGNNVDRPNLRGDDLNRLYASVPVTVGDSCNVKPDGRYWSDRVYEAPGRGGFLVHPWVQEIERELGAYPCWPLGHWEKLRDVLDGWLAHPEDREAKRREIASVVRDRCTYRDRVVEMLDVIGIPADAEVVA